MEVLVLLILLVPYFSPVFHSKQTLGKRIMKFVFLSGIILGAGTIFVTLFDVFFPAAIILPIGILILGYQMVNTP